VNFLKKIISLVCVSVCMLTLNSSNKIFSAGDNWRDMRIRELDRLGITITDLLTRIRNDYKIGQC
jgi:hypothetical protein